MPTREQIPLLQRSDIICAAGYLIGGAAAALSPEALRNRLFAARRDLYFSRRKACIDGTAQVMKSALEWRLPGSRFDALARQYYEMVLEDQWLQWSLMFRGSHNVRLETSGIEHIREARGTKGRRRLLEQLFLRLAATQNGASWRWSAFFDAERVGPRRPVPVVKARRALRGSLGASR